MEPSRGYLVCSIARTGSNLLGQTLTRTGVAGRLREWFNPGVLGSERMREILGDSDPVDGLSKIMIAGTTPNGVFGSKVHWVHFQYFGAQVVEKKTGEQRSPGGSAATHHNWLRQKLPELLSPQAACEYLESRMGKDIRAPASAYEQLQAHLPDLRFVHLTRRNLVACAISHFRALQSGVWVQPREQVHARQGKGEADFNFAEIHFCYCVSRFHHEQWQRFFAEQNISPHRIVYEDFVTDLAATVRGILDFMEIDSDATKIVTPRYEKLSDARSVEWEQRYRALCADAGFDL